MPIFQFTSLVGFILLLSLFITNHSKAETSQQAMPVDVVVVATESTRLWKTFSGRLTAVDYVEIRPQASGLITAINFEDGQLVAAGDLLYRIDPLPLQAVVDQKKANLTAAKNSHALAKKELVRAKDLLKKKMVSQQYYDERANNKLLTGFAIERIQAELAAAEIDLSYTNIKAPISGRISRTELTVGNLVSAGANAPVLTNIVSTGAIYADFEVDEQTFVTFSNNTSVSINQANPVELRLQSDGKIYHGKIHAFDNKIDPNSGTIRARAIFENDDNRLLPGMYAQLKLGSIDKSPHILLTERAIATDQNRKFVYVVNDDNIVTYREVKMGGSLHGKRIISSGLQAGDKVIVRGLMRIRPNMPVSPVIQSAGTASQP